MRDAMEPNDSGQFQFTKEQEGFRLEVAKFAETLRDTSMARAQGLEWFPDIYRQMGKNGLLGLSVSKGFGGVGAPAVNAGIAVEEIAKVDFHVSFALFNSLCTHALLSEFGTEKLRNVWLPKAMAGELTVSFSITEPGAGADARNISTRATRTEGGWILNGEKTSSGFAAHTDSTVFIARTGDGPEDFGAFFVPIEESGVKRERIQSSGWRPTGRGRFWLTDVFVPDEHVVGAPGEAFEVVMSTFDYTRAVLALMAIGSAATALDMAIEYGKDRVTFGQPLSTRQGYTFVVAEHLAELESVRWLAYRTLGLRDAGLNHVRESAMVKLLAGKYAVDTLRDVMVLFGNRSYAEDLPIWQMMRDLQGVEIAEGPPQIQKMIIAREAFGKSATSTGSRRSNASSPTQAEGRRNNG